MINYHKYRFILFIFLLIQIETSALSFGLFKSISRGMNKVAKSLTKLNQKNWEKFKDNFYEVVPGKLYRSKQIDAKSLDFYIKKYKIKNVVNLRGVNKDKEWWQEEKSIVAKNNVNFFNIPLFSRSLPSKENIKKLISIYDNAKGPIYVHCQGGADRTGLAVAVYMLLNGASIKRALTHLSIVYGHTSYSSTVAMDNFVKSWKGRDWALNEYDPDN